ncbi:MAG: hypothetical protein FGM41_12665, partial [Bacteroidetes bacterium]|nr:hypothetical protein [Bacteroidota bacterium]
EYYNSLNALEMENHYLGPIVLSRDMITSNLEFDTYFHEEGRIVNLKKENVINNGASFNNQLQHQYDYKDHLGYTRLTYVPKLINYDWFASFESLDQTNDQVYPGDITNLTYNPNKPRFERWMENRSSEDSYEGLFSAKVTDFNGPKIDLLTQPGDTLEISAYAKTNGIVEPPSITPSWILGLIGVIPNQYIINESGNYSYTGPQLTINFIPIIFNIINFFNNNPDNSSPSGALIARSFDSSNNVINAYSIPVSNQNWTEIKVTYPILDEREVKVEVFLASRPGNTTFYDNVSIQMKRNIPKIIQENHYTPFGLNIRGLEFVDGRDTNHFQLFGGEELVLRNKLELNDFGARWLDPQLGRFLSVDPMAQERPSWTPYNFCSDNPINRIDPDGRLDDIVITGENNSSVTLKTDMIDIKVNVTSLGINFGGNYVLQGEEVLSAGLDIVGMFDPTGVADGLGATLAAKNGDWLSAGISGLGIIPYVGDLAKAGKIGKDIKIIENAIEAVHGNSKLSQKTQHGYEIFNKKTGEILEYGISGQTLKKGGGSPRIDQKLNTKYGNNPDVGGRVTETSIPNRQTGLYWEQSKVNDHAKSNNGVGPRFQKRPQPKLKL